MSGRKPKKGLDWFPHEVHYSSDEDIEILIATYGQDGYAYPLHMYELIYRTRDGELDISDTEKRALAARKCLMDLDLWEKITQTALKYNIWDREKYENKNILTSDRIKEQMKPVLEKREKAKKMYEESKSCQGTNISKAEIGKKRGRNGQSREDKIKINNKELSPEALRLSGVLGNLILRNNSENRELNNGKKDTTINRWAKDIDHMLRLDKRTPEAIQKVILWCQNDEFWHKQILSGGALREKYDRLILEMAGSASGKGPAIGGRHGKPAHDPEEIKKIEERRERDREKRASSSHGTG